MGCVFGGRATGLAERDVPGAPPSRHVEPDGGGHGAILYFHGGGFIAGSPQSHSGLVRALVRRSQCRVVVPDYSLGPDQVLPAAQVDARAAWDALVAEGVAPSQIVLAGDSAGGGMALSLMAELGAEGVQPSGCIALCPWTDLTGSGASMIENARRDPLLPAERLPDLIGFATAPGEGDLRALSSAVVTTTQDQAVPLTTAVVPLTGHDDASRVYP